ncbi:MAG TPA: hypothetical protein VFO41_16710 [Alphaproteobacteria bacterium]|nr:hypothetical protein [Alphaproteobacteria bacterium]
MTRVFEEPEKRDDPAHIASAGPVMEIDGGFVYRYPRTADEKPAYRVSGDEWRDCDDNEPAFRVRGNVVYLYDDWSMPVYFLYD